MSSPWMEFHQVQTRLGAQSLYPQDCEIGRRGGRALQGWSGDWIVWTAHRDNGKAGLSDWSSHASPQGLCGSLQNEAKATESNYARMSLCSKRIIIDLRKLLNSQANMYETSRRKSWRIWPEFSCRPTRTTGGSLQNKAKQPTKQLHQLPFWMISN